MEEGKRGEKGRVFVIDGAFFATALICLSALLVWLLVNLFR